jgi:hypothetical protein
MKVRLFLGTMLLSVLLLSTSCKKEVRDKTTEENQLSASLNASTKNATKAETSDAASAKMLETELLKSLRRATANYHSTTQAIKAGYEPDDHCVSVPGLGGMGYHWVNPSLVDPVFDAMKPEALLYASGPGGNLRLVGVEYVVINVGQQRPSFGNQLFDIGGTPVPVPHWSLHVWVHENNPSGMFKPFNPNITCP